MTFGALRELKMSTKRELERLRAALPKEQLEAIEKELAEEREAERVAFLAAATGSGSPPPLVSVDGSARGEVSARADESAGGRVSSPAGRSSSVATTSQKQRKFPDVGTFSGESGEGGLAFIARFESAAEAVQRDDQEMKIELICRLRGKASEWLSRLPMEHKYSYSALKEAFLKRWERKRGAIAAVKLSSLRQKKEQDADTFLDECLTVFQEVSLDPDSELAKQYYVGGLRSDVQNAVLAHLDMEINDLAAYASQVEQAVRRGWQQRRGGRPEADGVSAGSSGSKGERVLTCYSCGKPGHKRAECPDKKQGADATAPAKPKQQATPSGSSGSAAKAATTFGASQGK